jgi:hypothetical protein
MQVNINMLFCSLDLTETNIWVILVFMVQNTIKYMGKAYNGLVSRIYMSLIGPLEQRYFKIYFSLMVHDGYGYFVVAQGNVPTILFSFKQIHQNGRK